MEKDILRTEKKIIDGNEYAVTVFPGLFGLRIKAKLLKFIGPAIGNAISGLNFQKDKSILENQVDAAVLGKAIQGLTENLTDENFIDLIKELLQNTRMDGKELTEAVLNIHFAGKYTTLYKVLIFVIEANRFFGQWNIGNLLKRVETTNIPAK